MTVNLAVGIRHHLSNMRRRGLNVL